MTAAPKCACERVAVLCGCGWGRLAMPECEVPMDCPQCNRQIGPDYREPCVGPLPRYFVAVWHGEGGSTAEIRDRNNPDECVSYFSTIRDGAAWRTKVDAECARLNAVATRACECCGADPGEPCRPDCFAEPGRA